MKTVKKRAARKSPAAKAQSKYSCALCGSVIEVDPCGCGCGCEPAALVCCGEKMKKKRA